MQTRHRSLRPHGYQIRILALTFPLDHCADVAACIFTMALRFSTRN